MENKHRSGRRYDREFKENAVALYKSSGKTVRQVANELGVTNWSLGKWIKGENLGLEQSEPATLAAESAEAREIRRLRMELEYVQRQRDILKKALSIVAEEGQGNATR